MALMICKSIAGRQWGCTQKHLGRQNRTRDNSEGIKPISETGLYMNHWGNEDMSNSFPEGPPSIDFPSSSHADAGKKRRAI